MEAVVGAALGCVRCGDGRREFGCLEMGCRADLAGLGQLAVMCGDNGWQALALLSSSVVCRSFRLQRTFKARLF